MATTMPRAVNSTCWGEGRRVSLFLQPYNGRDGMSLRTRARDRYSQWIGLVGASEEPGHTHVPIQVAGSLQCIGEGTGMAHFSRSLSLDRLLFPSVERLTSFEDDPGS